MSPSFFKILYVEDEQLLGRIVKDSLESRGFRVLMLPDGKHVIEKFKEFQPDACILDVMLPHKDGFTVAQEIRELAPKIPILFLTAKTQAEDAVQGFQAGGNDYIRKPFSLEELIARIHNLLRLTQSPSSPSSDGGISIGRYLFFPQRYELRLGDQIKKISYREAELLSIFAENQNKIINRQEILLRVWHDDSFFNSRNLDVYITRLRNLLKDDPCIQIISIKNVGYHFLVG
ncbi:MAG: response regulator transcription factor [Cytophagales bacterium]|nr:response regulator transcription factor [Bernardetiaceae bacterium]MDW8210400.1 response regulator transcription factor [Cytophagales bacterium]